MPGALTQTLGLGIFLFATLGNQFSIDGDDYDGVPWAESLQGALAASGLFLAAVSAAALTQRELIKARDALKPLFDRQSATRPPIVITKDISEQQTSGLVVQGVLMIRMCLCLTGFVALMVIGTSVIAMVLADTPGWLAFVKTLPLDDVAQFCGGLLQGLRTCLMALGTRIIVQLTTRDSFIARQLPPSVTNFFIVATPICTETVFAMAILTRNIWALLSVPLKLIITLLQGPGQFFLNYICWHGGWLMPWKWYSIGAGVVAKDAFSGVLSSVIDELSVLAYPCLTAMVGTAIVLSPVGLKLLGPVCAQWRATHGVSQIPLALGVLFATHIFCFFSFDTIRVLAIRAHSLFGLDDAPEHNNFNWINERYCKPTDPYNVHTLARPLQLFCDFAVLAVVMLAGYIYRESDGSSVFARNRKGSVEMDGISSTAQDGSPMCSHAGQTSLGADENSNDTRGGATISSDPEEDDGRRVNRRESMHEPLLPQVVEGEESSPLNVPDPVQSDRQGPREGDEGSYSDENGLQSEEDEVEPTSRDHDSSAQVRYEKMRHYQNEVEYDVSDQSADGSADDRSREHDDGPLLRSNAQAATQPSYDLRRPHTRSCGQVASPPPLMPRSWRSGEAPLDNAGKRPPSRKVYTQQQNEVPPSIPKYYSERTVERQRNDAIDEMLASAHGGNQSPSASGRTPASSNDYRLPRDDAQRTQVAEADMSGDQGGTGGLRQREAGMNTYIRSAQRARRFGNGAPVVTSHSSENMADTETDDSALLQNVTHKEHTQPKWMGDLNAVDPHQSRTTAVTRGTIHAMGGSLIPGPPANKSKGIPHHRKLSRRASNENRAPGVRGAATRD